MSAHGPVEPLGVMERAMGIEPTSEAWEASILPLYDARSLFLIVLRNRFSVQRFRSLTRLHSGQSYMVILSKRVIHIEPLDVTQEASGSRRLRLFSQNLRMSA